MTSLRQFFSYMNDINFKYVVLRNWEGLPYDVALGEHSDLDLLVYDFDHFFEIFPEAKLEHDRPRVRTKLPIDDSYIYLDVRYVGDGYYPEDFQKAILETREKNERGFYTPNPIHHRIALAYHVVHHKNGMSPEYQKYLGDVKVSDLLEALKSSGIGWTVPEDKSVGKFNGYWRGCTSVVEKKDGLVVKTQEGYSNYKLLQNEYAILTNLNSRHFPKAHNLTEKSITIEDCGDPLGTENLPEDWKSQLIEILNDLKKHNVLHRDIRLDNLMVKDGVIKLIDFGWAKFTFESEEKQPPACLGYPNRPSSGFDDVYSMKQTIKQLEFALEECEVATR